VSGEAQTGDTLVLVVDDDADVRDSLRMLLESVGVEVLTYPSADALLAADPFADPRPKCLLLDVRMPGMSGMALLEHLHTTGNEIPTVMVTGYGDIPMAVRAMKLGAVDFVTKPVNHQALLDLIQNTLRRMPTQRSEAPSPETLERWRSLTPREQDVFHGITAGRSNKSVAFDLGLSVRTVEAHRARMMRKLGARNLADLVLLAVRLRVRPREGAVGSEQAEADPSEDDSQT